ncbi:hypothetical protein U9M48_022958 [Paspalum notatum var. saurae]|uniref:Integrase catalytic domain-containing protein n=1 Tax=Paspalum notatum var. saurae TaxID=547442 RepID=A0AAQ3WUL7_PASNO
MNFHAYVRTQFSRPVLAFQTDNGREFDNTTLRSFYRAHGIVLRMSCPYTSPQNGKAERILRTLNDGVRVLLLHASLPPRFWVEALHTSTFLLNRRPCKPKSLVTPYQLLYQRSPDYTSLRVFGCLCYPNTIATSAHKLAPRSVACAFLGYSQDHRGYRCYDMATKRVIVSRHVYFDEHVFPFCLATAPSPSSTATPAPWTPDVIPPPTPTPHPPRLGSANHGDRSPSQGAADPRAASPGPGAVDPRGVSSTPSPASSPACVNNHSSSPSARTTAGPPTPPSPPVPIPPVVDRATLVHPMTTRARAGVFKPHPRYAQVATTDAISPIPRSVHAALRDPNWRAAMQAEFDALITNDTWQLVPRPAGANIVTGKWIFCHKYKDDGSLERYKARWVVRGFTQRAGIDYGETYCPVVKSATVRTVLTLAASHEWPVHQLDVNNAFLHGVLDEQIFAKQPAGFIDSAHADHVCRLSKSLYGLKLAPRAWYTRFASFLGNIGFRPTKSDNSLFVLRQGNDSVYLLLYVDDIVLTASSSTLLRRVIDSISNEFKLKDMGPLHYFLGIQVQRTSHGFFLSQQHYANDLLDRAGMTDCRPCATPVDTAGKLSATAGNPVDDASSYRSIVGALQYLTMTRPDIQYAVQQACLHMHAPTANHLALVKRILRYIRGTTHLGLHLRGSKTLDLVAFSDADWAGCPDTRRSTSGYCVYLGDALRQTTVSRSSAEAEYRGVANAVAECTWLRQLLGELDCKVEKATVVFCDNVPACYMSTNPVYHRRTKHIELDVHFVREKVAIGHCRVLHVPTAQQFADVMTKGLPTASFEEFRTSLCVSGNDDAHTAGGC